MKKIQTVSGIIAPDKLGVTYCHDHLLFVPPPPYDDRDPDMRLDNVDKLIQEMKYFKLAGGNCIVEMTTIEMGRSPSGMKKISEDAGINVIAATGFNKDIFCKGVVSELDVDQIVSKMVADLLDGMSGTSIKAGLIKASSSLNQITEQEDKVFQAAIEAHKRTGAPISTHTEAGTMALEQVKLFIQGGVQPEHILIGHLDRNLDWEYLSSVADTGVYLGFDQISKEKYFPDAERIAIIKKLIENGHGHQIMLSGDIARKSYVPSYGFGFGPGYTYILWRFLPWMIESGISKEAVEDILINNPSKAFAWRE
jgi:phosphotriesterase-related protein